MVMRKYLLLLLMSLSFLSAYSQTWSVTHHDANAMKKIAAYDSCSFKDKDENLFIFWSNRQKKFRIITHSGIFDSEYGHWQADIEIEFYDINGKSIDKVETYGRVDKHNMDVLESWLFTKRAKKVISYLKGQKGSICFRLPIFRKIQRMEFIVPCMKNP